MTGDPCFPPTGRLRRGSAASGRARPQQHHETVGQELPGALESEAAVGAGDEGDGWFGPARHRVAGRPLAALPLLIFRPSFRDRVRKRETSASPGGVGS